MTTRAKLGAYQSPGAFSGLPIPNTIRDALGFVEMLGERFLWVDSLCIVQDDIVFKDTEIRNMSAIFANASLTIVAADSSDANSGLFGIRGHSRPRDCKQIVFDLCLGSKTALQQWPQSSGRPWCVWSTRGWTFQEWLFSERRIFFESNCIRWECSKKIYFEDVVDKTDGFPSFPRGEESMTTQNPILSRFPNLYGLGVCLRHYNNRNLTYPEDALNAFTGVMQALCLVFDGGFLSGLPVLFFHSTLLWQPESYAVRRRPTDGTARYLPSWSWAGWRCRIDYDGWSEGNNYIKRHRSLYTSWDHTIPLVQWYSHSDMDAERIPIVAESYEYKTKYANPESIPPAGWTRHPFPPSSLSPVQSLSDMEDIPSPGSPLSNDYDPESEFWYPSPVHFYTHDSEPDSEFWYPIPLTDPETSTASVVYAPFLSCRTRRSWVLTDGDASRTTPCHRCSVWLKDKNGTRCGRLILLESPPEDDEGKRVGEGYLGLSLELVEIAMGRDKKCLRGLNFNKTGYYEVYHVMWVEREGGVAYRRGLGEVLKEGWEAQELEWIDLKLG